MTASDPDPYFASHGKIPEGSERSRRFGTLALGSLGALVLELYVGFTLGFAPGWANGWPGGLTIYQVWSAGITTILFTILVTGAIGLGAILCLLLSKLATARPYAGIFFGIWILAWAALGMLICCWFYQESYTSALEMWPNGYNP